MPLKKISQMQMAKGSPMVSGLHCARI